MTDYETGAVRDTGGKGRCDLLPMCALLRISKHMENAISHYPERNWEKGLPMHSMLDSALRHTMKYMDGWDDEDHLAAAATNLLMALWTEEKMPDLQDIPGRKQGVWKRPDTGSTIQGIITKATEEAKLPETCSSYLVDKYDQYTYGRCMGTKEIDPCNCGGDKSKCDFYPEKRGHHE